MASVKAETPWSCGIAFSQQYNPQLLSLGWTTVLGVYHLSRPLINQVVIKYCQL